MGDGWTQFPRRLRRGPGYELTPDDGPGPSITLDNWLWSPQLQMHQSETSPRRCASCALGAVAVSEKPRVMAGGKRCRKAR